MSRLTDYGILLLAHLASDARARPNEVRNARELSQEAGLPQPAVSKLLKLLTREGFLESQRGAKGGYTLARPADAISVAAVIDALEGPIGLTDCSSGDGACDHEAQCMMRAPWQQINSAVRSTLEQIRLSDLVSSTAPLPLAVFEAAERRIQTHSQQNS